MRNHEARKRHARLLADPAIRPHGDLNTYNNWLCRCDECVEAYYDHRLRQSEERIRRTQARTTHRGPRAKVEPFGREWLEQ